jgi:Glucosidase II beta subunit-like protein
MELKNVMSAITLLLVVSVIGIVSIRSTSAQDSVGQYLDQDVSALFPNNAAYDPFVFDPYHVHGAPYGGYSRSVQSRLAALPLHLPEILEDDRLTLPSKPIYFEARDDFGRLFACRLYHEDELMPESLYDSMFSAPILRNKTHETEPNHAKNEEEFRNGRGDGNSGYIPSVDQLRNVELSKENDGTAPGDKSITSQPITGHLGSSTHNEGGVSATTDGIPHVTESKLQSSTVTKGTKSEIAPSAEPMVLQHATKSTQRNEMTTSKIEMRLEELKSICGQIHKGWWSYEWCYGESITQFHIEYNVETNTIQVESVLDMGRYETRNISLDIEALPPNEYAEDTPELARVTDVYSGGNVCDENGEARAVHVHMICCSDSIAQQHNGMLHKQGNPVASNIAVFVDIEEDEDVLCLYNATVCTPLLCDSEDVEADISDDTPKYRVLTQSAPSGDDSVLIKENEPIREILDRVLSMLCLQTNNGGWWTYEICYKQSIRQFHEAIGSKRNSAGANILAKVIETEHILGLYDATTEHTEISDLEEWRLVVNVTSVGMSSGSWGEGNGAYYEIEYTGGEVCDHTDVTDSAVVAGSTTGVGGIVARSSSVRYFCGEMYDISVHEDSTCHYIVQVKVPALCHHRLFRAPSAKKQVIKCLRIEE